MTKTTTKLYWMLAALAMAAIIIFACWQIFPGFGKEIKQLMADLLNSGQSTNQKSTSNLKQVTK